MQFKQFIDEMLIFNFLEIDESTFKKKKTKFSYKICYSLAITLLNKIYIITYFENLIIELHGLYTLNTHIKFCVNRILFTI